MQIDPFTLLAQLVNFALLVLLLRRFLYEPVTRVMEEREQAMAEEREEVERVREEAAARKRSLEEERRQLEKERSDAISKAEREADERRRDLLEEAREEARRAREQWAKDLDRQRDELRRSLRESIAQNAGVVARRALSDLADARLESQVVAAFCKRLRHLDEETRESLASSRNGEGEPRVEVRTTFELATEERACVEEAVGSVLGDDRPVAFSQSDEPVCGISLLVDRHEIAWSVDQYVEDVSWAAARGDRPDD